MSARLAPSGDGHLRIRRARADEAGTLAPLLTDLCRRSKAHWGYARELLERWSDELRITPADIERDAVLVAESADPTATPPTVRVVGFARIAADPPDGATPHDPRTGADAWARLRDLWVGPQDIGGGAGRALFHAACEVARTLPADRLRIVADPNAEGFYIRMGARRVGEEASEVVDGRRLPILVLDLHRPVGDAGVTRG